LLKAQTPLLRFVVDLLYNNLLYNKSTTNRSNGVLA